MRAHQCPQHNWPVEQDLAVYLCQVDQHYPSLSVNQERQLVGRLFDPSDDKQEVLRLLIEGNLNRIVTIAKRYQGKGVALGELISAANLTLVQTAQAFPPKPECLFRSVAKRRVHQALYHLTQSTTPFPSAEEDDVMVHFVDSAQVSLASLDEIIANITLSEEISEKDEDTPANLFEALANSNLLSYEEAAFHADWIPPAFWQKAFSTLSAQERKAITLRYRLGEKDPDHQLRTYKDIAAVMGVSGTSVSYHLKQGIKRLHRFLTSARSERETSPINTLPQQPFPNLPRVTPAPVAKRTQGKPMVNRPAATFVQKPSAQSNKSTPSQLYERFLRPTAQESSVSYPDNKGATTPPSRSGQARSENDTGNRPAWRGLFAESFSYPHVLQQFFTESADTLFATSFPYVEGTQPLSSGILQKATATLGSFSHGVTSLSWSPDASLLALTDLSGQIWIYNAMSGRLVSCTKQGEEVVSPVSWSSDGAYLAAGGSRGNMWIWDAQTGHLYQHIAAHQSAVRWLSWAPGGHRFASADRRLLHVWKYPFVPAASQHIFAPYGSTWHDLIWAPNSVLLAATTRPHWFLSRLLPDEQVSVWNTGTGKRLGTFSIEGLETDLGWSPTGKFLAALTTSLRASFVNIWSANNGTLLTQQRLSQAGWLHWSEKGDNLYILQKDGTLIILDASTGIPQSRIPITTKNIAVATWATRDLLLAFTHSGEHTVYFWSGLQ